MQVGGGAFQKYAFFICSLSSCLVYFFSLFQLSQMRPMWWWLCELSTWLVFTFWEPHTCLWLELTLTSLTLTKGYLQVGPPLLTKGDLAFYVHGCEKSSFLLLFQFWFILGYGPKSHLNLPTPPPFHLIWPISTQDLKEHLERKCVYSLTHTHKNQNQASIEITESSL